MNSTDSSDPLRNPSAPLPRGLRRRLLIFVLPLVLGPLLMLTVAPFVLTSQWFPLHSSNFWLQGVGYGDGLRNADCRVVVYGDSTAEVGVNPEVIRERTHLRTCNIAQEEGAIMLSGDRLLDDYLRRNATPRILLFLYAPEDFNAGTARAEHPIFEALTHELGGPNRRATLLPLLRTPEREFTGDYNGGREILFALFRKPIPVQNLTVRERTGGQLPLDPGQARFPCENFDTIPAPDPEWVKALRARYSRPGMTVLVDVMPLPDCDPGYPRFQQQFTGLADDLVMRLPAGLYGAGGRHLTPEGAVVLSDQLGEQILQHVSPDHSDQPTETR